MVEILIALALATTPPVAPVAPKEPSVATPLSPTLSPAGESEMKAPPMVDAQPVAPPDGPTPPPLTRKALCGELTRTSKELASARAKVEADRKALDGERKELEKLKAEIAQSRAGLRMETEKLEGLLNKRAGEAPPAVEPERRANKPSAARPQELDSLARTIKSMKPEAAAALVQRTEPNLAAALLKRMKPADAGAVMDRLKPDLAAELVVLMSSIPSAPAKGGGRL